uniref:Uncharacterized protein n=1 Tax=Sus scrofa TaxID=9823 RepID=A0A4X1URK8_PIG
IFIYLFFSFYGYSLGSPGEPPKCFQGNCKIQTVFMIKPRGYSNFCTMLSFPLTWVKDLALL